MKKLCLLPFLFLVSTLLLVGQNQPIHSKIKLPISHPEIMSELAALGLPADHFHKTEKNNIELVFSEEEISILDANGYNYEILIPDMRAHYLAGLINNPVESDQDCGLINFDAGEMGGYHSFDDAMTHITQMKSEYSNFVELLPLGTSIEGRTIMGVKISDNAAMDESATEATVHFDALHHAREPMSLESSLYYMWWLLESYATNPEASYLIDNREIYFIPIVNPDGYVYNQQTDPQGGGFWRKNRRDVNGCFGVDLNRNYSHGWGLNSGSSGDPCLNTYRGTMPFSEPESQAVRDLLAQTQPSIAFSIHTYGDVFLSPFGYTDSLATYDIYAEFVSEFIPETYKGYGTTAKMLGYTSSGTTRDYLHSEGVYAWTPEVGHDFWEQPSQICARVQEFMPAMKYLTWVSGNYACFHDFKLTSTAPVWEGENISLNVRIKNRGLSQTSNNVTVQVNSQHPAVTPITNIVSYGNIDARSFQDNTGDPFLFEVQSALTPGELIFFDVIVTQDGKESYRDAFYISAGEVTTLFTDDAESGMTQWFTEGDQLWDTTFMDAFSGGFSFADSRYGNYLPDSESSLLHLNSIDLSTAINPWLEFNAKWSLEGQFDFSSLEFSTNNGNNWFPLKAYTFNSHWVQERIDLNSFIGQSSLRFRFLLTADGGIHSDGFYFDDFKVVDYDEPDMVPTNNIDLQPFQSTVFPNPGNEPLQVLINSNENGPVRFTITDVLGRTIFEKQERLTSSINHFTFPSLKSGTYLLKIEAEGHTEIKKILR